MLHHKRQHGECMQNANTLALFGSNSFTSRLDTSTVCVGDDYSSASASQNWDGSVREDANAPSLAQERANDTPAFQSLCLDDESLLNCDSEHLSHE
jgi:hypothetical protein